MAMFKKEFLHFSNMIICSHIELCNILITFQNILS